MSDITIRDARIRKAAAFSLLETFCQQLEPTEIQMARAKQSYEAVGTWLSDSDHPFIHCTLIYPQGSASHGTMVKPINGNEHDVDLISLLKGATSMTPPAIVKKVIGDRLRANANYADKLEEMPRCWRVNYANEFHLDITPSIKNPNCSNGGELVPDKSLSKWKPSNPSGFRDLFQRRAALVPISRVRRAMDSVAASAEIVPFPTKSAVKGVLRRTVQLLKRHRDIFFSKLDPAHAPLSIIITTLASQSYEWCVGQDNAADDFDLLLNTMRMMPHFIDVKVIDGRTHWFVENETTEGENFAEKWNKEPARAYAFYHWHKNALHDFERILEFEGLDAMGSEMSRYLDRASVEKAVSAVTSNVSAARSTGSLVTGVTGLATASSALATPVKKNTFFGR